MLNTYLRIHQYLINLKQVCLRPERLKTKVSIAYAVELATTKFYQGREECLWTSDEGLHFTLTDIRRREAECQRIKPLTGAVAELADTAMDELKTWCAFHGRDAQIVGLVGEFETLRRNAGGEAAGKLEERRGS
ncbi:MAG: hypothetical protein Q9162_000035, partial [Coniocarpon cinnabarinum]